MVKLTIQVCGKTIEITGAGDTARGIAFDIRRPLQVESETRSDDRGFMQFILFGKAWKWESRDMETRTKYAAELAEYIAALPEKVTSRSAKTLPSTQWYKNYVPTESEAKALNGQTVEAGCTMVA